MVRLAPRVDGREIGDDHHGEIGLGDAQELGAEARPQAAMLIVWQAPPRSSICTPR